MSARCLVLGGSGAVGTAVRRVLEREGATVRHTYLSRPTPDGLACDLRDFASVERVVGQAAEQMGGLDALIQAAAVCGDSYYFERLSTPEHDRLQKVDQAAFDELMEVNVRGTFAACRAAAPYLQRQGGNVVLLASIDGLKPVASPIHYAASQAALRGLTESLTRELGHHDVRVNLLAIGILEGGLAVKVGREVRQAYLDHTALGRLGTPDEIAEFTAWMALENTYVTGQTIMLDGGL